MTFKCQDRKEGAHGEAIVWSRDRLWSAPPCANRELRQITSPLLASEPNESLQGRMLLSLDFCEVESPHLGNNRF